jgi:hypothetical protein
MSAEQITWFDLLAFFDFLVKRGALTQKELSGHLKEFLQPPEVDKKKKKVDKK